jgi:hypothetical protein
VNDRSVVPCYVRRFTPQVADGDVFGELEMGKIYLGVNMEFVRSADKPFEWGVDKAAELGYQFVEPMVHWGRELLSEAERGEVSGTPVGCACGEGVINWVKVIEICRTLPRDIVFGVECGTIDRAARSIQHLRGLL